MPLGPKQFSSTKATLQISTHSRYPSAEKYVEVIFRGNEYQ